MVKIKTFLLLLSFSFVTSINVQPVTEINTEKSNELISANIHHSRFLLSFHKNKVKKHKEQSHKVKKQVMKNKKIAKTVKNIKYLRLTNQVLKPQQPKFFFDEVFSNFQNPNDFVDVFPPQYFSFASQKFQGSSSIAIINIRNKPNPVQYFENQVKILFQSPNIKFVSVDEINPDTFSKKKNNKYDSKELEAKTKSFLNVLKNFGENPIYQGRINLFVTNVNPSLFGKYPEYKHFISEILRLSHMNYLGIIYVENYRGPITKSYASACLKSFSKKQACIDSVSAPVNSLQWSSTNSRSPLEVLNNYRNLLAPLCKECNVARIVMPTYGLSNANGVCMNGCFREGFQCRDDLKALSNLVKTFAQMDNVNVAFYGAYHVYNTNDLIMQNGAYYDIEAFLCEIVDAVTPDSGTCI